MQRRRLDRFRLSGGLEPQTVQPGFQFDLAGEGLALIGPCSQAFDFIAVLFGLEALLIKRRRSRSRLPDLGLGGGGGDEDDQAEGGAEGDHRTKMAPAVPSTKRGGHRAPGRAQTRERFTEASSSSRVVVT